MLTRKSGNGIALVDNVKVVHNGSELEVKKVLQLDPGASEPIEVFPSPAHRLRIIATALDAALPETTIKETQYPVIVISTSYGSYVIDVEVWPKNAGWKLTSPTGVYLGDHEGVTYYGDQRITMPPLEELEEEGLRVSHCITVIPSKGSLAEPCNYWLQQYRGPSINIDPLITYAFSENGLGLNFTLEDTNGLHALANIHENAMNLAQIVPYSFRAGPKNGMLALSGEFNSLYNNTEDFPYPTNTIRYYQSDIRDVLNPNWFYDGMSLTGLVYPGVNVTFGLADIDAHPTDASQRYAFSLASIYGYIKYSGAIGFISAFPQQGGSQLVRKWQHLGLTVQNMGDITTHPNLEVFVYDEETDPLVAQFHPVTLGVDFDTTPGEWGKGWEHVLPPSQTHANYVYLAIKYVSPTNPDYSYVFKINGWDFPNTGTSLYPVVNNTFNSLQGLSYKLYQNGLLVGEQVGIKGANLWTAMLTEQSVHPANGEFIVRFNNDNLDDTTTPQAITNINIYDGAVPVELMQIETVNAGLTVGTAGGISRPWNQDDSRKWFHQDIADVDFSTLFTKGWMIDDETLVFGIDPFEFYQAQLKIEKANWWVDSYNMEYGHTPEWSKRMKFEYNWYELQAKYDSRFVDELDDAANFLTVTTTSTGLPRAFTKIGRYSDMVSNFILTDGWKNTANPEASYTHDYNSYSWATMVMNQFVYIKLSEPLAVDSAVTVTYRGQSVVIANNRGTISSAIKANQLGYRADTVTAKTAYVGQWLGFDLYNPTWSNRAWDPTLSTFKSNPWDLTFYLVEADDPSNTPVYTGTATVRQYTETEDKMPYYDVNGYKVLDIQQTGEKVWELSFTEFGTPGEYQIYIPTIGYSWPFTIGNEAAASAFVTHMKGLWHHRSGDPNLKAPYTAWEMPFASQESWEGQYPALDNNGFQSYANGEFVEQNGVTWRDVIGAHFGSHVPSQTGRRFRDVKGGWRDAADLDRRTWHSRITRGLCEQFLFSPTKFSDGQLNLHESGQGIPDILSEAEWGMEIWRRTQRDDGAVSGWCETDVHEMYYALAKDTGYRYTLSAPDCYSSLIFAQNAAMLARCFAILDNDIGRKKSAVWHNAAVKAFNFGKDPDNIQPYQYSVGDSVWTYTENYERSEESARSRMWPTAASLFMMTGDTEYTEYFTDQNWRAFFRTVNTNFGKSTSTNFSYETLVEMEKYTPRETAMLRKIVLNFAEFWDFSYENGAYRQPHFNTGHQSVNYNLILDPNDATMNITHMVINEKQEGAFSEFTQLAGGHMDQAAMNFVYAYMFTGDQRWMDALQKQTDFINGANPIGVTETTGLGHVNPVWGLQGQMFDEFREGVQVEPIPGISFYTHWNTATALSQASGINKNAWINTLRARFDQPTFSGNFDIKIPGNYRQKFGTRSLTESAAAYPANELRKMIPKWRPRYNKCGAWFPAAGEYTIWECMYIKAIAAAMLLEPGADTSSTANKHTTKETVRRNVEGWFHLS